MLSLEPTGVIVLGTARMNFMGKVKPTYDL